MGGGTHSTVSRTGLEREFEFGGVVWGGGFQDAWFERMQGSHSAPALG